MNGKKKSPRIDWLDKLVDLITGAILVLLGALIQRLLGQTQAVASNYRLYYTLFALHSQGIYENLSSNRHCNYSNRTCFSSPQLDSEKKEKVFLKISIKKEKSCSSFLGLRMIFHHQDLPKVNPAFLCPQNVANLFQNVKPSPKQGQKGKKVRLKCFFIVANLFQNVKPSPGKKTGRKD